MSPRLLAISDIHGCLCALETLLTQIRPVPGDTIVVLGDTVDRGPDSRGVIERLIQLSHQVRLVCLMGNHEEIMLSALEQPSGLAFWGMLGGESTVRSYGGDYHKCNLATIPDSHLQFIRSFTDYYETDSAIFVHGMVAHDRLLAEQASRPMRWTKFRSPRPHFSGKTIICGHTAQRTGLPLNHGYAICLDTWVYGEGWLSCLEVGSDRIWQANQACVTRKLSLADHFIQPDSR